MIVKRGEIWIADLNPIRGSEQAGTRPVVIFQKDRISNHFVVIAKETVSLEETVNFVT